MASGDVPGGAIAVGVPVLVLVGYLALASPRGSIALVAAMALAAWGFAAFHRPRFALMASFPLLLVAGTKFRLRDADASLAGLLDAQILLELALFAVIAAGLAGVWLATRPRGRLSGVEAVVAAYATLAVASTLWSVAPALTAVRAGQLAVVAILAIVAVRVLAPSAAVWTVARGSTLYVVVCAGTALLVPSTADAGYFDEGFRFTWFATHPITAGTLAAVAALGLLSAVLFRRSGWWPILSALTIGLCVVLFMTGSRGPMLAFAAAAAVLCVMRLHGGFRIAAVLAAAIPALAAIVFADDLRSWLGWMADQNSWISGLLFRGQSADQVLELNGRIGLWAAVWPEVLAHPLVGYGYQASRTVLLDAAGWAGYAHNALLQTLLDLGVVGTIALMAVIVTGLRVGFRRGRTGSAGPAVAALMVFLALNSVSTESFAGAPGFETLVLFVCVLCTGAAGRPRTANDGATP
jgi:O-antigen ligase